MSAPVQRLRALPAPGERLAHYVIERELGRGGMGRVYVAREERLDRRVALKVLAPEIASDPVFRERFVRESRLAAAIPHPHVVPIYNAGDEDGALFIAMYLVEGSLKDQLRRSGPPDVTRALAAIDQIGGALDAAHRAGLVHRDVKPANILVEQSDLHAMPHCYLTDFGISKNVDSDQPLTGTGQALGSPNYMAPEQIEGRRVSARTDVYGLGCVLFELLTGRVPFPREGADATCFAHLHEAPPSARAACPQLPSSIDRVIATALAKRQDDRYADCRALAVAAREAMFGPPSTASAPAPIITSSAARTSPEPQPLPGPAFANGNGAPPHHRPYATAPAPAPKRKRGWVVPVLIVLGALLLAGGGIAAALLLTGDDGPSQAELDKAKRMLDETNRINKHLRELADQAKAGDHATERQLLAQQRQAAALREAAERDLASDRELRESIVAANLALERAARELRRARDDRRGAIGAAENQLDEATDQAGVAENILDRLTGADNRSKPPGRPKVAAPVSLTLPGDASWRVVPEPGGQVHEVFAAGDLNGDQAKDLLFTGELDDASQGYSVFAGEKRSVKLGSLGSNGFRTLNSASPLGAHPAPAGDLDDDGRADIVVSGLTGGGSGGDEFLTVVDGGSAADVDIADRTSLTTIGFPYATEFGCTGLDSPPASARGAGDVNGDGSADLLVTAPCRGDGGEAWVMFGPLEGDLSLDGLTGDTGFTITGGRTDGAPGIGVSADAGRDVNDDGYDDVVLGQPDSATAYVILGGESPQDVDVESLGSAGYELSSSRAEGRAGASVALVDDMTGDGRAEVVVGAPQESTGGGAASGAAYVVFGQDQPSDVELTGLGGGGFAVDGPAAGDGSSFTGLGTSAAAAGDPNGDGIPDVILGAPGLDGAGIAYIVYGKASEDSIALEKPGTKAARIDYERSAEFVSVAGGGDYDGDGRDDVVVLPAWTNGEATDAPEITGSTAYVVGIKP